MYINLCYKAYAETQHFSIRTLYIYTYINKFNIISIRHHQFETLK